MDLRDSESPLNPELKHSNDDSLQVSCHRSHKNNKKNVSDLMFIKSKTQLPPVEVKPKVRHLSKTKTKEATGSSASLGEARMSTGKQWKWGAIELLSNEQESGSEHKVDSKSEKVSEDTGGRDSDDLSRHAVATASGKSDNKSYKEKLRERFHSVKHRAGKSSYKAHKIHSLKTKSDHILKLSKSVRLMQRENDEMESEINSYRKRNVRLEEGCNIISKTEAEHFFNYEAQEKEDNEAMGVSSY